MTILRSLKIDRPAKTHVGEMALIDNGMPRSATVSAREDMVVFRVPQDAFSKLAYSHPEIWHNMSRELSRRLRQRNKHVRIGNGKPHLFIGSSKEQFKRVRVMDSFMKRRKVQCLPWQTLFAPGSITIDALLAATVKADFAALIISNDDVTTSRHKQEKSPRDNVLLELGLFMGRLGRERTFVIHEKGAKVPSDLSGLTRIPFSSPASFLKGCEAVKNQIVHLGPL